ncbi:SMI1/KNR4 family protein [Hahella sp. NBU794]|uniref:SMI1/KNR4 family protein n=1 Tax=Hahella sp. NBU794 TaxID=3422590 RepID=UPI003D6F1358
MSSFEDAYQEMLTEGIISGANIGCSSTEIAAIEHKYGITLPQSYKEFLRRCGRSCEALDDNEFNYQYEHVKDMTELLIKGRQRLLVEEDELTDPFPDSIFFIMERYGDEFNYIIANSEADSPVYYYNYPLDTVKKVFDSVGDWFKAHAADMNSFKEQGL